MANKPEYQDISTLDTLNSVTETAWAPVVDKNKTGKKVDLSTLVPNSMQNFESVNELTTEQKAAFLGSAAVPACGTVETNGTKVTKSIPVNELVPVNIVVDDNYVHTDNNFTNSLKSKLNNIANGAEVNIQSDWNETSSSSDAFIKNKPTVYSADGKTIITTNDNKLLLYGFSAAKADYIPYKSGSSSNSTLQWKPLTFSDILRRSYNLLSGTARQITYEDYFPLIKASDVSSSVGTAGDPYYEDSEHNNWAIFYYGNATEYPNSVYALDFIIEEDEEKPGSYKHNLWRYALDDSLNPSYIDIDSLDGIQIVILRPNPSGWVTPLYTNLIKIEPGDHNYELALQIAYIDIEPPTETDYYDWTTDPAANFTQLTCITTTNHIDTSKPGYIRITGDVFEIMQ